MKRKTDEVVEALVEGLERHADDLDVTWDYALAPQMTMGPQGPVPGEPAIIFYFMVPNLIIGDPAIFIPLPVPFGIHADQMDGLTQKVCFNLRQGRSDYLQRATANAQQQPSVGDQIRGIVPARG